MSQHLHTSTACTALAWRRAAKIDNATQIVHMLPI